MNWHRFKSLPVVAVVILIGTLYYISLFVITPDWVGIYTSNWFTHAFILTSMVCLCLFSFFVAVLTNPGDVPPSYVPDMEDTVGSDQEHLNKKPVCALSIHFFNSFITFVF